AERPGPVNGGRGATAPGEGHDPGSDRPPAACRGASPVRGARAGTPRQSGPSARQRDDPDPADEHTEREPASVRAAGRSGATRASPCSGVAPGARGAPAVADRPANRGGAARATPAIGPSRHAYSGSHAHAPSRAAGRGPAREPPGSRGKAGTDSTDATPGPATGSSSPPATRCAASP